MTDTRPAADARPGDAYQGGESLAAGPGQPDPRPRGTHEPDAHVPDGWLPDPHDTIQQLADSVLPALIARLDASGLGELEVRADGWHVRLRKPYDRRRSVVLPEGRRRPHEHGDAGHARRSEPAEAGRAGRHDGPGIDDPRAVASDARPEPPAIATAPAVGYFAPRDGWGPGRHVRSGDVVGYVDCLGVRQDVVAPVDGFLGRLLAQPGEAVEYGQPLLHVDLPVARGSGPTERTADGGGTEAGSSAASEPAGATRNGTEAETMGRPDAAQADKPGPPATAADVPERAVRSAPGARPEGA